uniref:RdRp n=1 Tax=Pseudopestalotiopsis camelliae-sinensis polymycovirus 1 TaxID=3367397 RepID=A0AB74UEV1_9VIRU
MSTNSGMYGEEPLRVVSTTVPGPGTVTSIARLSAMAELSSRVLLRGGLFSAKRNFMIAPAPGAQPQPVMVQGPPVAQTPPFVAPFARASAFRVNKLADGDIIAALRAYDQPRPAATGRKVPFWRSSARLVDAVKRASTLDNPSFSVSEFQLPKAYTFGGGPATPERPLLAPVMGGARRAARIVNKPGYAEMARAAVELGDYTTHDPETLHPRFLNYVHERIEVVDTPTHDAITAAIALRKRKWVKQGLNVKARPLSDAEPGPLLDMLKSGSPGEYRSLGAVNRRDPKLVATISGSLMRYGHVGRLVASGRRAPAWVSRTQQPTLQFGKEEPKEADIVDGKRVPPVLRFIFNPSPINYGLGAFLHGDISHFLQAHDYTHGPGFGPSRGRSDTFLRIVNKCFASGTVVPPTERMVMSDIHKWDANMREVLIGYTIDMLESCVDKSSLSPEAAATRSAMYSVARRQLMHKLLEHPSGYLVNLHGCMPSGSFYTSLVNTEGNNLLLLGHVIDRLVRERSYTPEFASLELDDVVDDRYASYGDNQLFSEAIFSHFGLAYDVDKHAEFLARFGMKLKVKETEVATELSRVRFCSRAVVMTPHGPLVTRTHSSLYKKLAGRPEHDAITDKLYVRAMMADHLGTDPIVYELLAGIDRCIDVDATITEVTPKIMPVISSAAKSLLGDDSNASLSAVLQSITGSTVERRALLSLHTRPVPPGQAGGATRSELRLGSALTVGGGLLGGPLTPAAEWAYRQSPADYARYLDETNQTGLYMD